ncbi:hypothetical protein [Mycolicibacterium phage Kashi_SSH1]|nr:hypothetical protein [Mycolicibacterium phage Kashi_SSH1]
MADRVDLGSEVFDDFSRPETSPLGPPFWSGPFSWTDGGMAEAGWRLLGFLGEEGVVLARDADDTQLGSS